MSIIWQIVAAFVGGVLGSAATIAIMEWRASRATFGVATGAALDKWALTFGLKRRRGWIFKESDHALKIRIIDVVTDRRGAKPW